MRGRVYARVCLVVVGLCAQACSDSGPELLGGSAQRFVSAVSETSFIRGSVELSGPGACSGVPISVQGPSFVTDLTTVENGDFVLESLAPGAYSVRIRPDGYDSFEDVLILDGAEGKDLGLIALQNETVPIEGTVLLADGANPAGSSFSVSGEVDPFIPEGVECANDGDLGSLIQESTVLVDSDGGYEARVPRRGRGVRTVARRNGYAEVHSDVDETRLESATESEPVSLGDTVLYPLTGFVNVVGGTIHNTPDVSLQISAFNGVSKMSLGEVDTSSGLCSYEPWITYSAVTNHVLSVGDGSKTICVRIRNEFDQVLALPTVSVVIDTKAPSGSLLIDGGLGSTNDEEVVLNLTAGDSGTGVDFIRLGNSQTEMQASELDFVAARNWFLDVSPFAPPLTETEQLEGQRTVWYQVVDRAGNASVPVSQSIYLDNVRPYAAVVTLASGLAATNVAQISVTLSQIGATEMKISQNPVFAGAAWFEVTSAIDFFLTGLDGLQTVYVQLRDNAGNQLESPLSSSIILDRTAPVIDQFTINGGDFYANSTTLNFDLNVSGDPATVILSDESGAIYSGTFSPNLTDTVSAGEGNRTVLVKVADALGNQSISAFDTIWVDTVSPGGQILIESGDEFTKDGNPAINLFASDSGSGISQVRIANVASGDLAAAAVAVAAAPLVPFENTKIWTLAPPTNSFEGPKYVAVQYYDNAGNPSPVTLDSIQFDDLPPQNLAILIEGGAQFTRLDTVGLTISADGADEIRLSNLGTFGGVAWVPMPVGGVVSGWKLDGGEVDGTKSVFFEARDQAGNVAPAVADSIYLKVTEPSILGVFLNGSNAGYPYINTFATDLTIYAIGAAQNISITQLGGNSFLYDFVTNGTSEFVNSPVAVTLAPLGLTGATDGLYSVSVTTADFFNFPSPVETGEIFIDTIAPAVTVVTIEGGATVTNSTIVEIDLTDAGDLPDGDGDASGLRYIRIANSAATVSDATAIAITATTLYTLSPAPTPGTEEVHPIFVVVEDRAGNLSNVYSTAITVDLLPPLVTSYSVNGSTENSRIAATAIDVEFVQVDAVDMVIGVSLTNSCEDAKVMYDGAFSSPETIALSNAVQAGQEADGFKRFCATLIDAYGNTTEVYELVVEVDRTAPDISNVELQANNDPFHTTTVIPINFDNPDGTAYQIAVFKGSSGSPFFGPVLIGSMPVSVTLTAGDGVYSDVSIRVADDLGNTTSKINTINSINLDTVAPTGSVSIAAQSGFPRTNTEQVDLTFVYADPASGAPPYKSDIKEVHWANSLGDLLALPAVAAGSGSPQSYVSWFLDAAAAGTEEVRTVYFRALDNAGNFGNVETDSIVIDTLSPEATAYTILPIRSGLAATNSVNVVVNLDFATDTLSTLDAIRVYEGSGSCAGASVTIGPANSYAWTMDPVDGQQFISFVLEDIAGNNTASCISTTVVLDRAAPAGSVVTPIPGSLVAAFPGTITGNAADTAGAFDAGVQLIEVSIEDLNTGRFWDGAEFGSSGQVYLDASGTTVWNLGGYSAQNGVTTYEIEIRVTDRLGNNGTFVSVFDLDSIAPSCGTCIAVAVPTYPWTPTAGVMLDLDAIDDNGPVEMLVDGDIVDAIKGVWIAFGSTTAVTLTGGDGTKTVSVSYRDVLANTSAVYTDAITLDTAAPAAAVTLEGGAPTTSVALATADLWSPDAVTYDLSGDLVSGIAGAVMGASTTVTLFGGDTTKTVVFTVYDAAGNSSTVTDSILLDTTPPVLGGIVLAGGNAAVNNSSVALTVTAAVDSFQMQLTGDVVATGWVPFNASTIQTLSAGDGPKTAWLRVRDDLGNVSVPTADSIILDTTPPAGTIVPAASVTASVAVSLTLNNSDANAVTAALLGGNITSPVSWFAPIAATSVLLTVGDAVKSISYSLVDLAGNIGGPFVAQVTLDTTGPTGSVVPVTEYTNQVTVALNLVASDPRMPLEMLISGDIIDGFKDTWIGFNTVQLVQLAAADGVSSVTVRFRDSVLNESPVYSTTITHDTVAPAADVTTPADSALLNSFPGTLLGTANDAGPAPSQVSAVEISVVDQNSFYWDGAGFNGPAEWRFPAAGTTAWTLSGFIGQDGVTSYTINAFVIDRAGNLAVETSTFDLDSIPPTCSPCVDADHAANPNYPLVNTFDTVEFLFDASDDNAPIEMRLSGGDIVSPAPGTWFTIAASLDLELTPGDGTKNIGVEYRDVLGNIVAALATTYVIVDADPADGAASISAPVVGAGPATSAAFVWVDITILGLDTPADMKELRVYTTDPIACSGAPDSTQNQVEAYGWTLPTTDGVANIGFRLVDNADNIGGCFGASVTVDTVAPTATVTSPVTGLTPWPFQISGNSVDPGLAPTGVTFLTVSVFDGTFYFHPGLNTFISPVEIRMAATGTDPWSSPVMPAQTGSKTFTVQVYPVDAVGNVGSGSSTFQIDTQEPQCTTCLNIDIPNNTDEEFSNTVQVDLVGLDATDANAPVQMFVSGSGVDGVATTFKDSWIDVPATASQRITLTTGESIKTVTVRYRDGLLNETADYADAVTLDQTGPGGTVSVSSPTVNSVPMTANTFVYVDLLLAGPDTIADVPTLLVYETDSICADPLESAQAFPANFSYFYSGLDADNTNAISFRYVDRAGNESACLGDIRGDIVSDRTNPDLTVTGPAGGSSHSAMPVFSGTSGDPNAPTKGAGVTTVVIQAVDTSSGLYYDESSGQFDSSAANWFEVNDTGTDFSTWNYTFSAQSGTTTFTVVSRASDGVSRARSDSRSFLFDSDAPTCITCITIDVPRYPWVNFLTVNLDLEAVDGAGSGVADIRLTGNIIDGIAGTWIPYVATTNVTLALANGVNTVNVEFRDALGNASGVFSDSVTHDNVAPTAATFEIEGGAAATSATLVNLAFAGYSDTVTYNLTGSGDVVEQFGQSITDFSTATLTTGDGTKNLTVTFYDSAGNAFSFPESIDLDQTAPGSVLIDLAGGANSTSSPVVSSPISGGGAPFEFRVTGDVTAPLGWYLFAGASPLAVTLSTANVTNTVWIAMRDILGNTSAPVSDSIYFDTIDPTGSITAAVAITSVADITVFLSWADANPNPVTHARVIDDVIGGATNWFAPQSSTNVSMVAGTGNKNLRLALIDDAGNSALIGPLVISLDQDAPTGSITANTVATNSVTISSSFFVTGANPPFQMKVTGPSIVWPVGWAAFAASATVQVSGADGEKSIYVTYRDGLGNESVPYGAVVTLDTAVPSVVILDPAGGITSVVSNPMNGTSADGLSGVEAVGISVFDTDSMMYWDGGAFGSATELTFPVAGTTTWSWSHTIAAGTNTDYVVSAYVTDVAGNIGDNFVSYTLDTIAPTCSECNEIRVDGVSSEWTTSEPVFVQVGSVTELHGPVEVRYSGNITDPFAGTWFAYVAPGTTVHVQNLNGDNSIAVELRDSVGNVAGPYSDDVTHDNLPPTVSFQIAGGANKVSQVTVSAVVGSLSPDAATTDVFGNLTAAVVGQAVPLNTSVNLDAGEFTKIVTAVVYDIAGNSASATNYVTLDQTPPTLSGVNWFAVSDTTLDADSHPVTRSAVELRWTASAVPDFDRYRITRRIGGSGAWEQIVEPVVLELKDNTGIQTGSLHQYRLYTVDDAGNSSATFLVTETTPIAPPAFAVIVMGESGYGIDVEWAALSGYTNENTGYSSENSAGTATIGGYASISPAGGIYSWPKDSLPYLQYNDELTFHVSNPQGALAYLSSFEMPFNRRETVSNTGDQGEFSSIYTDPLGRSYISFVDVGTGDLLFATDESGSWSVDVVDSASSVTGNTSIAVDVTGEVHIAYHDAFAGTLRYANRSTGGSWTTELVDSYGVPGTFNALDLDPTGSPVIGYASYRSSGDAIVVASRSGSSWVTAVASVNQVSLDAVGIGVDGIGGVHLAYRNAVYSSLNYATDESGSFVTETVSNQVDSGYSPSIDIDGDRVVHISYLRGNGQVRYATGNSGAWSRDTVNSGTVHSGPTDIAVGASGIAHIVYFDVASGNLMYAAGKSGDNWSSKTLPVDFSGAVGLSPSIAVDGTGTPHVSYFDQDNTALKYVRLTGDDSLPTAVLVSGSAVGGDGNNDQEAANIRAWTSLAIDRFGHQHVSFYGSNGDMYYANNVTGFWEVQLIRLANDVGKMSNIDVDEDGNVYILYFEDSNDDLYFSNNKTGAWVTESIATTSNNIGFMNDLAVGADGRIHAIDYDDTDNDIRYIIGTDGNGDGDYDWTVRDLVSNDIIAEDSGRSERMLEFELDANNIAHITWALDDNNADADEEWRYVTYDTINDVVGAEELIATATAAYRYTWLDLEIGSDGAIYIAATERHRGNDQPWLVSLATRSIDGTWAVEDGVDPDPSEQEGLWMRLELDDHDNVHMIYVKDLEDPGNDEDMRYARKINGSWSFSNLFSVDDYEKFQHPAFKIAPDGTLHMVYVDDVDNDGGNLMSYSDFARVLTPKNTVTNP